MTRASQLRGFLVALFSLLALRAARVDARYRGRAVGGRRISGRGMGPRAADRVGIGRKLLDDATEVAPVLREDGHCVVAYDQIARRPALSELKEVIDTLPRIKDKLQDPTRVFTLFCPTNDAIEKLRAWEDWEAARRDLVDAFGSTRLMRAYLLAYHAVPNVTYTMSQLERLRGDDRFLEDYLNNVMPLYVVEQKANRCGNLRTRVRRTNSRSGYSRVRRHSPHHRPRLTALRRRRRSRQRTGISIDLGHGRASQAIRSTAPHRRREELDSVFRRPGRRRRRRRHRIRPVGVDRSGVRIRRRRLKVIESNTTLPFVMIHSPTFHPTLAERSENLSLAPHTPARVLVVMASGLRTLARVTLARHTRACPRAYGRALASTASNRKLALATPLTDRNASTMSSARTCGARIAVRTRATTSYPSCATMKTMPKPGKRHGDLPKNFEHQNVEENLYEWWESRGYFAPNDETATGPPFVIPMPPPNVTGALHMGHAMFVTLQDVMTRSARMRGRKTLWLPGTDHAGIATQLVVERKLESEGVKRTDMTRDEFVERVWEWKAEYGGRIQQQIKRLGASCDWSRERFTLDEGLSESVLEAFITLHDRGLIYKGTYMVNWAPKLQTAVSDLEVEYTEEPGTLYFFKYPVEGGGADDYLPVATTRPETILGDTAVAVNPEDDRFKHMIGKRCVVPFTDGRTVPIIGDSYVDMEFGTGALKITPGHDPNDYEIGKRVGLDLINIMNKDGSMNSNCGKYTASIARIAESNSGRIWRRKV